MYSSDSSSTSPSPRRSPCPSPPPTLALPSQIIDVWEYNFDAEMKKISSLLPHYPIISFDTEFPGIVGENGLQLPVLPYFSYRVVKTSVERTNLIQLGLTLSARNGDFPEKATTWQFNFQFDIDYENYNGNSLDMLFDAGLDFEKHKTQGINPQKFAESMMTSGLVLNSEITWVCYHGIFDIAYVIRLLTGDTFLPATENEFKDQLALYMPHIIDVKKIGNKELKLEGGLAKLGSNLGILRDGTIHQAGSDSLFTAKIYNRLMALYEKGKIQEFCEGLYGFEETVIKFKEIPKIKPFYPKRLLKEKLEIMQHDKIEGEIDQQIRKKGKVKKSKKEGDAISVCAN